jgi:hypothetical protein
MATDKAESTFYKQMLKQFQNSDAKLEKIIKERVEKETAGMGGLKSFIAASRISQEVAQQYLVATKGITGERTKIFKMLGINLGPAAQKLLEKKASPGDIEKAKKALGLDKEEKEKKRGLASISKPLSIIIKEVLAVKKSVRAVEKLLTQKSIQGKYVFDPRLGSTGRFRNVETNKIVSNKEVAAANRTQALTKAIYADEDPMKLMEESLGDLSKKIKDFDIMRLERKIDALSASIDPSLFGMFMNMKKGKGKALAGILGVGRTSVHDKLDLLLLKSNVPNRNNIVTPDGKKPPPGKPTGRFSGILGTGLKGLSAIGIADMLTSALGATDTTRGGAEIGRDAAIKGAATAYIAKQGVNAIADVKNMPKGAANSTWRKFMAFVAKRSPVLYKAVAKRLAAVGVGLGLGATGVGAIPGLLVILVNAGFAVWTAMDILELWKEFNNIPEEKVGDAAAAETNAAVPNVPVTPTPSARTQTGATQAELRAVSQLGSAKEAMDFFMSGPGGGYSRAVAAGIVGNLIQESKLKTDAKNDKEGAYGIAQWRGERKTRFAQIFGKPIEKSTFAEQLQYVAWELNNSASPEYKVGRKLRDMQTPTSAALYVDKFYERSAGTEARMRADYAEQLFANNYKERVAAGLAGTGSNIPAAEAAAGITAGTAAAPAAAAPTAATQTAVPFIPSTEAAVSAANYDRGWRSERPSVPAEIALNDMKARQLTAREGDYEAFIAQMDEKTNKMLLQPMPSSLSNMISSQSQQMIANQLAAAAGPAAPIVINQAPPAPQPIQPPKTPIAQASPRSDESAFMRATLKDFNHPSAILDYYA